MELLGSTPLFDLFNRQPSDKSLQIETARNFRTLHVFVFNAEQIS